MSACAGSSIERLGVSSLQTRIQGFTPSGSRDGPGRDGTIFLKYFAGQDRTDSGAGRIGFMSTQRREDRRCWSRMERTRTFAPRISGSFVRYGHADANGRTAPPAFPSSGKDLSLRNPGLPGRLATDSLRTNGRNLEFVWLVRWDSRRSAPVLTADRSDAPGVPYHPAYPTPARFPLIRPALPHFPARSSRWAERYDGKRDLYFQHAARNAACNS
jgi:hypothetical protein